MIGASKYEMRDYDVYFKSMGRKIFYTGQKGLGLISKLCNNFLLAINMLALSQCYSVANSNSMDLNLFQELIDNSSGNSWSNSNYCPAPNIIKSVPSSNQYSPGFDISLMIKDLNASKEIFQHSPREFKNIFEETLNTYISTKNFINLEKVDFSIIFKYLEHFTNNPFSKIDNNYDRDGSEF